jgi:serine/threonine protein kinase/Tfp pilus assembly protein PilF
MRCPKCQADNPETQRFCGECGLPLSAPRRQDQPPVVTETLQTPVHELTAGSTFAGRYQVIEELGHGGMGRVYKVFDTKIKEKIALKLIRAEIASDRDTLERFGSEIRLARRIGHRNVCKMFDLGEAGGAHFITMEYVHGEDLKCMIEMTGSLSLGMILNVGKQIADGLAEAHSLGVVHRDLKPQNIMIDKHGNAKIMDFGIARSVREKGITGPSVLIGTPEYMSPEQAEAQEVDQRSDIYSLGVILYEMATSHVPFTGETALSIAMKHKGEIPKSPKQLNPQIPDDLSAVILKCLEKDKAKRYQNASDVRSELEKIEKGIPTTERVVPERKTITSREITVKFSLNKLLGPAVALIALLVVGFVIWHVVLRKRTVVGPKIENSVAVISFENQTGDKSYDYLQKAIPHLLITSLEQKGRVYVPTWERLRDILKQIGQGNSDTIGPDLGFELCRREGVQALVLGSFMKAGDIFALDVRVLDVETKKLLKSASSKGKGVDSILASQIDELSAEIWGEMGLTGAGDQFASTKVANVTTNSMEAYNLFTKADDEINRGHDETARQLLVKALELDPTFALAHDWLGATYAVLGDVKASREEYELAKRFSEKATEKERLYIEANYAGNVKHDRAAYVDLLEQLVRKYPREKQFHEDLGYMIRDTDVPRAIEEFNKVIELDPQFGPALNDLGRIYRKTGEYEKAIEAYRRYAAVYPGEADPLDSMAYTYLRKGDFDQAQQKWKEALAIDPGNPSSLVGMFYVSALRQDYSGAKEWVDRSVSSAKSPNDIYNAHIDRSLLEFWRGRFDGAKGDLRVAAELADTLSNKGRRILADFVGGCFALARGEFERGRKDLEAGWDLETEMYSLDFPERKLIYGYPLVLCELELGRIAAAKSRWAVIQGYLKQPPDADTWDMALMLDLLSVEIQLREERVHLAAGLSTRVGELKPPVVLSWIYLPAYNLIPFKDILARVYQKNGEIDKAIAEYERLTTPGPQNVSRAWIHPLYYYRLGKLYEQKSAKLRAGESYRRFLDLWKDADPGLPEVEDAKQRLTGLRGR